MNSYQDRGIIKWMPFDALTGFGELIRDLTHAHKDVEVPFVFEDTLSVFEYTLLEAYQNKQLLYVTYISKKRKQSCYGYVNDIDVKQKTIRLSSGDVIDVSTIVDMMV
jgi:hypothetical protein